MHNSFQGIGMTSMRTRERMIEHLKQKGITNSSVIEAMRIVPRHIFVDEALASRAYEDTALPIGYGQTISQPYAVAIMTQLLIGQTNVSRVLEIGTGCGYQTAVLSKIVESVHSIERIKALQNSAATRFRKLHIQNIRLQHSDGLLGWPQEAPFDGILVTAAPQSVPQELLNQLSIGGRLVIPIGERDQQQLTVITRDETGFNEIKFDDVKFVALLGGIN